MPLVKKEVFVEATPQQVYLDEFETVPRGEWVTADIPSETLMGDAFPTIRIGTHAWGPGRHDMPPHYAEHIKEIVGNVQREAVRRLQPKKDLKALRQQANGGSNAAEAVEGNLSLITGRRVD